MMNSQEALTRAVGLLDAIKEDFESGHTTDTRKLEDSLTGLERMLNQALLSAASTTELETAKKESQAQLKPYRSHMRHVGLQPDGRRLVAQTFARSSLEFTA